MFKFEFDLERCIKILKELMTPIPVKYTADYE
jgi:hypothetical protein